MAKRIRPKRSTQRRTREASYAYRGPLLLLCTYTQPYQPHNTTRTVVVPWQRALVTVTSSGTTFLTLARARPALGAPFSFPFVSLSFFLPPPPSTLLFSVRRESWPTAREGYERCEDPCKTHGFLVRSKTNEARSREDHSRRARPRELVRIRSININDSLCSLCSDVDWFSSLDFSSTRRDNPSHTRRLARFF